ncbi:MAG: peptidase [Gemmatimonadetes bacterium]|nr:peptidase [Gemmatimonadota bacterium]
MPSPRTLAALPLAAAAVMAAAAAGAQTVPANPGPPLSRANLDTTCAPCRNFYQYANGGWMASNPIPAAFSSWSGFNELTERNNLVLKEVLEAAARDAETTPSADTRRLGRFYGTCMDSARTERDGIAPIAADLRRIDALRSRGDLQGYIGALHREGMGGLFGFGSSQDAKNSTRVIAEAGQGGLGLPDRDYYTRQDSATAKARDNYVQHVQRVLALAGEPAAQAAADAQRVLALETALAAASMSRVQMRDPNAQYHIMTVAALDAMAPGFSFATYLRDVGLPSITEMNVAQPDFFKAMGRELATRPVEDWKAYFRFRLVNGASSWLSTPFVAEGFRYTSGLTGAREMQPRWKRCLRMADNFLGDALGQAYVRVAYTPEAKAAMEDMLRNMRAVYAERIRAADWMSDSTKQAALEKLGTFNQKLGYPSVWQDYSRMSIATGPFIANVRAAGRYEEDRDRAKIGRPVDRNEWGMTAPTVNAYYNPAMNEIVFPAGRLQPPFFHPSYDVAANYGGIGGTIGHEMTHGFDDQGRQFDAQGNLREWWTAEDVRRFGERAQKVENQYNAYVVLDSMHVNGKLTMGENIADIGGMTIAYYAMEKALEGRPRELIDGFTPEQRFFLAYAQARRAVFRPQQLRLMVQTDPHSPNEFRVNGPLSNMPEFAAAFGCKQGDPMVRAEELRAKIW